jgi:hypothetical protein
MPGQRMTTVVLIAGSVALAAVVPAAAKQPAASPCKAPKTGFQSCLRVLYQAADDGSIENVRATATLLLRVDQCPAKSAKRRVVISRDGDKLASARPAAKCRKGIVTWRARFPGSDTASWGLAKGDTVDADWAGVKHASSVAIRGK